MKAAGDFVLDEGKKALLSSLPEAVGQGRRSLTVIAQARGLSRQSVRAEGCHVVNRGGRIIELAGAAVLNHLEQSHRLSMRRRGAQEWSMDDGMIRRRLP